MNFLSTKRRSHSLLNGHPKSGQFTVNPNHFDPKYQAEQGIISPLEDIANQLIRLNKQNEQLVSFAEHMCRQIRSVTGNLGLTVELLEQTSNEQERKELMQQIAVISATMNQTVDQLNQMAYCSRLSPDQKEKVSMSSALSKSIVQINALIHESEAEIFSDFSEVPEILFNTKLLESIFKSLIEYSIIHAPAQRKPAIDIFSYQENDENILLIKDNSDGSIITKLSGPQAGMEETNNIDSDILTFNALKLQIEQLGGHLEITANSSVGSSIKVRF
jgi:light-regulated signal transduction histidine kinase (bacteriophytochrome)